MSSQELENVKQRLEKLELEIKQLKKVVRGLEKTEKIATVSNEISKPKFEIPIRETLETFLGTNLISKAGFLAIILAFIWFLSYAFQNYWINESGRIIFSIVGGYFLWGLSLYFYKRNYTKLSPAMLGTGITIVLLGVFSAYRFYDFFTLSETFIYIFLLSIIIVFFSKITQSQALYIFGILVVFLNPVLLSTGENSYKFLFSYLTFWNLVHIWIGKKFLWRFASFFIPILNLSLYGIWAFKNLQQSSFFISFSFLFLSFLGILIREMFFQLQLTSQFHWASAASILLVIIGYSSLIQVTSNHFYPEFTPVLLILLAIIPLFLLTYPVLNIESEKLHEISWSIILGSSYLFIFATLSVWREEWQNLPLLIVSSAIVTLGAKQNKMIVYIIGFILWILSLFSLIFFLSGTPTTGTFVFNTRFLIYVFSSIALFLTYKFIPQNTQMPFTNFYYFSSFFLIVFASLVEINHYIVNSSYKNLGYSYVLAFYSILFFIWGFIKNSIQVRKIGIGLVILLVVKFYIYDIWSLSLIVKIIAGFTLGIGLVLVGMFYERFKSKLLGEDQ